MGIYCPADLVWPTKMEEIDDHIQLGIDYLCSELGAVKFSAIAKIIPIGKRERHYFILTPADMGGHTAVIGEIPRCLFIALKVGDRIRVFQIHPRSILTCRHGKARYNGPFTGAMEGYPLRQCKTSIDSRFHVLADYFEAQRTIRAVLMILWAASNRTTIDSGQRNFLRELESMSLLNCVLSYLHPNFK